MLQQSQAQPHATHQANGKHFKLMSRQSCNTTQHRRTERRGVQGRCVKVGQRVGRHGVAELPVTGGGLVGHPGSQQALREHAKTMSLCS